MLAASEVGCHREGKIKPNQVTQKQTGTATGAASLAHPRAHLGLTSSAFSVIFSLAPFSCSLVRITMSAPFVYNRIFPLGSRTVGSRPA